MPCSPTCVKERLVSGGRRDASVGQMLRGFGNGVRPLSERDCSDGVRLKNLTRLNRCSYIMPATCMVNERRLLNAMGHTPVCLLFWTLWKAACWSVGRTSSILSTSLKLMVGCMMHFFRFCALPTTSTSARDSLYGSETSSKSVRCLAATARFRSTSMCSKRWTVTRDMRYSDRLKTVLTNARGTGFRAPDRSRCSHNFGSLER